MHATTRFALVFIAACALSTGASAQKVYKCGSSYSQTPCQDGVALQADDARTPAQKAAAEKLAREEAKLGTQLEKTRLKDEAQADAARKPTQPDAKPAKKEDAAAKKKKNKEPEYFTAKNPAAPQKK
ncbi:hypothetical protein [uncultured Rhodoferax sp.]|uniref:hypothetical protein n=1 Tax=uncultured Rhodoferax sp. TaxID=223188 RepID=UPI0025F7DF9A|nr:hypothetical protein [uncultured Rhodoferax sp.]